MSHGVETQLIAPALSSPPAANEPSVADAPGARSKIVDVWSHQTRRNRTLAIILLATNLLLFVALCVFVHWLHFAIPFDFSWESYVAPLRVVGPDTQTLNDFVIYPISVIQKPIHAVVLGSLLASIIAVPIVIAILYRFPFALPFVACVLIFAHMPWLAFTLLLSCVLASVRPFRLPFRYGAALVGLLPVLVYMVLAARGGPAGALLASPEERQLLAAPWVLAVLGAAVMLALVLGLARLVNYRPGVVTPVLAATFATPAILFDRAVGADELSYRVLLKQCGPQSDLFESVSDVGPQLLRLIHRWTDAPPNEVAAMQATIGGLIGGDPVARSQVSARLLGRFQTELMERRRAAYDTCKQFIADHPRSRYVDEVLFLQARVLDLRLQEGALASASPARVVYDNFPHVQSLAVWERLLAQYPRSPFAAVAALRSAQLHQRAGEIEPAIERLRSLPPRDAALEPIDPTLRFDARIDQREALELLDLLQRTRGDPRYGDAPLRELASLDPRRASYRAELARLATRYPGAVAGPDIRLRWILGESDPKARAALLEEFAKSCPGAPALQANLQLGELQLLALSRDDAAMRQVGVERLIAVRDAAPGSIWAERADELLQRVAPASASSSPPLIIPASAPTPPAPENADR